MAIITIRDNGQDLKFRISKMPATKAEAWMLKALALMGKGMDFSGDQTASSLISALCSAPFDEAKGLLDDLLSCCEKVDGKAFRQVDLDDCDGYISSPLTLVKLRIEAIKENFGFFLDFSDAGFLAELNGKQIAEK